MYGEHHINYVKSFGLHQDFSALSLLLCDYRSSPDNIPNFLNNCSKFMKLKIIEHLIFLKYFHKKLINIIMYFN